MNNDFADTWAPVWIVQESIPGALKYIVENTTRAFKSGRPVIEAVFFDEHRTEVARREGMVLTSKKGKEYAVCRREDPTPATVAPTVCLFNEQVTEIFADI